jgi:ATP-binding cassette subfamily B protein
MIQRGAASQKRLNEFLQTTPKIVSPASGPITSFNEAIVFDRVNFTYPHTHIHAIKDFSLTIKKGEKVAIIGRTGSGKSTIAQLLLRMYDVSSGNIFIDGRNINSVQISSLRSNISYVPQDGFLFSDTVESNISFGTLSADDEKIKQAAFRAVVDKEIESFPAAYQTIVGERGVTLSGGQKQRVSIARALMKSAPVLILDDALSAVDAKTEKQILQNLDEYLDNKTAIFITHRIFNLLNFDKIIVLDDGRIAEQGTHEELLLNEGLYTEMHIRQQMSDDDNKNSANLAVAKT